MTRTDALVQLAAGAFAAIPKDRFASIDPSPEEVAAAMASSTLSYLEEQAEEDEKPLQFDPSRAEELEQLPQRLLDVLTRLGLVHEVSMGESDAPH